VGIVYERDDIRALDLDVFLAPDAEETHLGEDSDAADSLASADATDEQKKETERAHGDAPESLQRTLWQAEELPTPADHTPQVSGAPRLCTEEILTYQPHDLAQLMPTATRKDYEKLRDDVVVRGFQEDIVVYENAILDGNTRVAVAREIRRPDRPLYYREFIGSQEEARAFVYAVAIRRKAMSTAARAFTAVKLKPMFEAAATARQRAGKAADDPTQEVAEGQAGEVNELVGELFGVSKELVRRAQQIEDVAPEIRDAATGRGRWSCPLKMSMADAQWLLQLDSNERSRILNAATQGKSSITRQRKEVIKRTARRGPTTPEMFLDKVRTLYSRLPDELRGPACDALADWVRGKTNNPPETPKTPAQGHRLSRKQRRCSSKSGSGSSTNEDNTPAKASCFEFNLACPEWDQVFREIFGNVGATYGLRKGSTDGSLLRTLSDPRMTPESESFLEQFLAEVRKQALKDGDDNTWKEIGAELIREHLPKNRHRLFQLDDQLQPGNAIPKDEDDARSRSTLSPAAGTSKPESSKKTTDTNNLSVQPQSAKVGSPRSADTRSPKKTSVPEKTRGKRTGNQE
jgi:hypothetical protein